MGRHEKTIGKPWEDNEKPIENQEKPPKHKRKTKETPKENKNTGKKLNQLRAKGVSVHMYPIS